MILFRKIRNGVPISDVLFLVVAPLIALFSFEGFSRGGLLDVFAWIHTSPLLFFINYGMFAALFWVLSFLRSDRARSFCFIVIITFWGLLGIINFYKIHYRYEPVLLTDALLVQDFQTTLESFEIDVNWLWIIGLGTGITVMLLATALLKGKQRTRSWVWTVLGICLACTLLPACRFGNPYVQLQTDLVGYSRTAGSLFTVFASEKRRRSVQYSGYVPANAEEAYREIKGLATNDADNTPNIILILSESFIDQASLGQYLDFTETVMPFYEQLASQCISGFIFVPKLGGGTSETEFEVLTGMRVDYANNPYSAGLPGLHSLAAVLRERGYTATAIHWNAGVYYNRYRNHEQLGFDALYTTDTTSTRFQKAPQYVSDAEHYRSALQIMAETKGRDFVFCITMQNHFPYHTDNFPAEYEESVPFSNLLSAYATKLLSRYCHLLRKSDEALQEFIEELVSFGEPTMVVFFSDHIPPLGEDVFMEIGIPLSGDAGYKAPYFIWSNTGNMPERVNMNAWQLGAFALDRAGILSDPFFRHIERLREMGVDEDDRYRLLTYDALFGVQASYQLENLTPQSSRWSIGGEMRLIGIDALELGGWIYLFPGLSDNSQVFELYANGVKLDEWRVLPTEQAVTLQCLMTNANGLVYNQSNRLTFRSSADLLANAGQPKVTEFPLHRQVYVLEERGDLIIATAQCEISAEASVLEVDGEPFQWIQQRYSVSKAGQFYVRNQNIHREQSPLVIALDRHVLMGYETSGSGICEYLADHNAKLLLLGECAIADPF